MDLTVNGSDVFAATGGRPFDAAEASVVLLHGAGMDHTIWSLQSRYFAHHDRALLAVDFPGHGRSGGDALGSIDAMADWIIALLDAAGVKTAALAGHSMGGFAALETAARAPGRVRALALLGIGAKLPVHPDLVASAKAGEHLAFELITSWGFDTAAHFGGHTSPGMWMMDGAVRLLERSPPGALHADLEACNDYGDALDAASRVRCPTLLLLGEGDRMKPPAKGRLAELIADCRTVVLERCGHMMMVERPDATTDALSEIL